MRRIVAIELNRDRDYPRFSGKYFRKRWFWLTTFSNEGPKKPYELYKGNAAFALTALFKSHFPRLFGKPTKRWDLWNS